MFFRFCKIKHLFCTKEGMLITLSRKLINNNISNIAISINSKIKSEKKKSDIFNRFSR